MEKANIEWPYRCQIRRHNRPTRHSRRLSPCYLCLSLSLVGRPYSMLAVVSAHTRPTAAAAAEWTFTLDSGAHTRHSHFAPLDSIYRLAFSLQNLPLTKTTYKRWPVIPFLARLFFSFTSSWLVPLPYQWFPMIKRFSIYRLPIITSFFLVTWFERETGKLYASRISCVKCRCVGRHISS